MFLNSIRTLMALALTLTSVSARAATYDDLPPEERRPLTQPGQMPPLNRSVLDEADDKLQSPEARQRNHWIMDQLWTTKLGQEYLAYLTDQMAPEMVPGRALQLVERVYGKGKHVGKRQKAIEAFTLDLYARGRLNDDIIKRSFIYNAIAKQKDTDGMDKNGAVVFKMAIVGAVAATILASPVARGELVKLKKIIFNGCRGRACEPLSSVRWKSAIHPRSFITDYEFRTFWEVFATIAGGGSMLYSFVIEKMPGFQKDVDLDREMLDGRENLLVELEF